MGRDRRRGMRRWLAAIGLACAGVLFAAAATATETVGEARVRRDLEEFVRARAADSSVVVEIPGLSLFRVDPARVSGSLRTEMSTRSEPPLHGRVAISVALFDGDRLLRRGIVSPYARVERRVVVAARDLARGEVIDEGDIDYANRDMSRLKSDVIADGDLALGQRVRRSMRAGAPLRAAQLETVPVVERGQRVGLVLESGALRIQGSARALEAGAIGEWIRVLNLDSKRELSGRVDREGRVHVAF